MSRTRAFLLVAALTLTGCQGGPREAVQRPAPVESVTSTATAAPTPARSALPSPRVTPKPKPHGTTAAPTVAPRPVATRAAGGARYVFPLKCSASYGRSHHDYPATDLFAARGCRFVSAVAGRVDEVSYTDRWSSSTNRGADRGGLSVSVVGRDGVRYYGSHLERIAPGIKPGAVVAVGAVLGYVGSTGSARGTAPHLHFGISWPTRAGIWWVRRGEVYPWPYLDSWKAGGQKSPAAAVEAKRRRVGTVPPCPSYC